MEQAGTLIKKFFLTTLKKVSFAWTRPGYFYKKVTTIKKIPQNYKK